MTCNRPNGVTAAVGRAAPYAWVPLWCGDELGWVGFDPTNDRQVVDDHILLGQEHDFFDIAPVEGIIIGSRKQQLGAAVDNVLVD